MDGDELLDRLLVRNSLEIVTHLAFRDFRIEDGDLGPLFHQVLDNGDGGGFTVNGLIGV